MKPRIGSRMIVTVCLCLAMLVVGPLLVSGTAFANYTVSVGYSDDLRPSPIFPNPWCGAAVVSLFAGAGDICAGGGAAFDGGAIMITNTGLTPITINSVSATVPSAACCSGPTNIWSGFLPFTLNPGKDAIFAQTVGENFDTSDFGLPGIGPSPFNNCSVGAESTSAECLSNIPTVTTTVGGVGTTFKDTAFVLDTGGYDAVNSDPCFSTGGPGNCNESLPWRQIGGSGLVPTPEPSSLVYLGSLMPGVIGLVWTRRRKVVTVR